MNLDSCAHIRRGLHGENELPEVLLIVDGVSPPSAIIVPTVRGSAEDDIAAMTKARQKRDAAGRFASRKGLRPQAF
jgi:hypothetical protein